MELGNFTAFGEDLNLSNPHWLNIYGRLLMLLADLNMAETVHLIKYPVKEAEDGYEEFTEGQREIEDFLENKGLYVEGFTARCVCPWFLYFCQCWHKENTEVQLKAKKDKIKALKEEIKELEK